MGDSSTLYASGGVAYSWLNIGIGDSVMVSPNATTTYTVVGLGTNGCYNLATTSVQLSVITATAVSDKTTICPGFSANLNVNVSGSTTSVNYLWTPSAHLNHDNVQNPTATLDSTTTFVVEVSNQDGCWDKDTLTVNVSRDAACVIYIYNGITPNGDGNNDVWAIDGIQSFPNNNVKIFNRWGAQVWEGSGYNNKDVVWKGKNSKGDDLPDGTYYYIVELYDTDGTVLYSASKWVEVTH
jgi:gliding motility-associated-like protein